MSELGKIKLKLIAYTIALHCFHSIGRVSSENLNGLVEQYIASYENLLCRFNNKQENPLPEEVHFSNPGSMAAETSNNSNWVILAERKPRYTDLCSPSDKSGLCTFWDLGVLQHVLLTLCCEFFILIFLGCVCHSLIIIREVLIFTLSIFTAL